MLIKVSMSSTIQNFMLSMCSILVRYTNKGTYLKLHEEWLNSALFSHQFKCHMFLDYLPVQSNVNLSTENRKIIPLQWYTGIYPMWVILNRKHSDLLKPLTINGCTCFTWCYIYTHILYFLWPPLQRSVCIDFDRL